MDGHYARIFTMRIEVLARHYFSLCLVLIGALAAAEEPATFEQVRPILNEYCIKCHSTAKHKGDLDLERFATLGEIRKNSKVWQLVAEQLTAAEMPPAKEKQPPDANTER